MAVLGCLQDVKRPTRGAEYSPVFCRGYNARGYTVTGLFLMVLCLTVGTAVTLIPNTERHLNPALGDGGH